MGITTPTIPTEIDGLKEDSRTSGSLPAHNPVVATGRALCWEGQTSNTSAGNVANQQVGTFAVPSGTASGTTLTAVANTQVGTNSLIEILGIKGDPGVLVVCVVTGRTNGTSFTVKVYTNGATTAAVDVHYRITN